MLTEDILHLAHFDNARFFDTQAEALGFLRSVITQER